MHPRSIRLIDYWIGIPLCAALTLCRRVMPERPAGGRRIAFLKFIEQGATVLAQDAIRRATEWVGRENVWFCVFESNRSVLDLLDVVDARNVIVIRDRGLAICLFDFLAAALTLRRRGVDVVIDLEFFSRASAAFAFLTGARSRVGLHRFTSEQPYRGDLMTHRVLYNPYLHVSMQYSVLLESARLAPSGEPMLKARLPPDPAPSSRFQPTDAELEAMRLRIASWADTLGAPAGQRRLILLNPNASDLLPLRKWPTERFVALGQQVLADDPAALVIITGAPSEQASADRVCDRIGSPRAKSFAGRTTLRELLTLYTVADALVTNDSGPAHFASLTAIPVVVLFGPETPHLFGSLAPSTRIIWKGLACSPCVSVLNHRFSPCHDNVCMQAITTAEVYEALRECLDGRDVPVARAT